MAKDFEYYLALMRDNVSGLDTSEGSVVDGIFRAVAYALAAAQYDLQGFAEIAFPADGSGEYLDARAADVGLTRKPGTKARASVTFVGEEDTFIPANVSVTTNNGLVYRTIADDSIGSSGRVDMIVEAENVGVLYNVRENAIVLLEQVQLFSVQGSSAASGGSDPETDAELLARLQAYLHRAPASGNEAQYLDWALSVPGVGFARVVPRPDGDPYAVKLILVGSDMQPASAAVVSAVDEYLDSVREVNIVTSAVAATAKTINVAATVTLDAGTTAADVEQKFRERLDAYAAELIKSGSDMVYVRVGAMLMGVAGVQNYSSLQINGAAADVSFDATEVPIVGTITLTAAS